jgi:hypothetical protein
MSSRIGAISAFAIPSYLMTDEATTREDKSNMYYMYLVLSITCTLMCISTLFGE